MLQVATFLALLLYAITALPPSDAEAGSENTTIYEVLKDHGLPMGLLPKGVRSFRIDEGGRFEVALPAPCNAKFESVVHYEANVSGAISYGQIGELSGVEAQELFLWFPVKGIRVDVPSSGVIYFDVGVIKKQYSLSLFDTPPDCQAGGLRKVANDPEENGDMKIQHVVGTKDVKKAAL